MRTSQIGLFAVLSCSVITTHAYGQAQTGACTPTKVRYISASAGGTTHSTTPVNFLANNVNFVQGGASASCVIVRFSAHAEGNSGNTVVVRAVMDGATLGLQPDMLFSDGGDLVTQARSFDFIFPNVAPGNHSIRVQFRSPSGNDVSIGQHNIIVQYK